MAGIFLWDKLFEVFLVNHKIFYLQLNKVCVIHKIYPTKSTHCMV